MIPRTPPARRARTSSLGVVVASRRKHRPGATVDIHVQDHLLQAWDGELLKSVVRDNTKEVRKKRASSQRR